MATNTSTGNEQPFPRGAGRPAASAFELAGYTRYEELAGLSATELLKLHGVGPKSIRVINEHLLARGLDPIIADDKRVQ